MITNNNIVYSTNHPKERNQSIELLRIILMTLIIFGHIVYHGIPSNYDADGNPNIRAFAWPFYSYHVDTFMFISGYYGIKLKWDRFASLVIKMIIYSFIVVGLMGVLSPDFKIVFPSFGNYIYPRSDCDRWFMSQYLFVMLLSQIINTGMDSLTKKQSSILIIVMYIATYSTFYCLLLFIYMFARHLRKYPIEWFEKHSAKIFLCTIAIYSALHIYGIYSHNYFDYLFNYINPFLIIASAALFFTFKKFSFKSNIIGYIASGVLAAYLITDHSLIRPLFTGTLAPLFDNNILQIMGGALIVVVVASFVDKIINIPVNYTCLFIKQIIKK